MSIGQRIRAIRKDRGLTQEGLAQKSGVSFTSIVYYENKRIKQPRNDTLKKIAGALNVTVDELLDNPEETERELRLENLKNLLRNLTDASTRNLSPTELATVTAQILNVYDHLDKEAER